MRKCNILLLALLALCGSAWGQTVDLQGYVFEANNRGYLNMVRINIYNAQTNALIHRTESNMEGVFSAELPLDGAFRITAEKDLFEKMEVTTDTKDRKAGEKLFLKMEMKRKPGYLFDVTVAEKRKGKDAPTDAIAGALIEVYNNTTSKEVLILKDYPHPNFKVTFENGNHYTLLIRKKGFFNKRMEAYVNVKGCILCFDGVGTVKPGVSDVLTEGHTMGTLLANVELEPIKVNKSIRLEKIYYDKNKADIRPDAAEELDKVVQMMQDNPSVLVELGSHTDARGDSRFNQRLSQKRAESAVKYIVAGGIKEYRITAKGYGESKLVNSCGNDVDCPERKHQRNRRTEIKITGYMRMKEDERKSLADIIAAEEFEKTLAQLQDQEVVRIPADGELPEEIRKQIEEQEAKSKEAAKKDTQAPSAQAPKPVAPSESDPAPEELSNTPDQSANVDKKPDAPQKNQQATVAEMEARRRVIGKSDPVGGSTAQSSESFPAPKLKRQAQPSADSLPIDSRDEPLTAVVEEGEERFGEEDEIGQGGGMVKEEALAVQRYAKGPKRLVDKFTGYVVEFYASPYELPASHEIFSNHGEVLFDQNKE
ncbi:MAG: OmpA family protein, partial [Bacteroidota bacterium]